MGKLEKILRSEEFLERIREVSHKSSENSAEYGFSVASDLNLDRFVYGDVVGGGSEDDSLELRNFYLESLKDHIEEKRYAIHQLDMGEKITIHSHGKSDNFYPSLGDFECLFDSPNYDKGEGRGKVMGIVSLASGENSPALLLLQSKDKSKESLEYASMISEELDREVVQGMKVEDLPNSEVFRIMENNGSLNSAVISYELGSEGIKISEIRGNLDDFVFG